MGNLVQILNDARAAARRIAAGGGVDPNQAQALDSQFNIAIQTAQHDAMFPLAQRRGSGWDRPMPNRVMRPSGVTSVAAGTTSGAYNIQWPTKGVCVGITGGTIDNTAVSLGAMSARVTKGGVQDLFTDGQAAQFCQFSTAFSNPDGQTTWLPTCIYFEQSETWQVYFKNESASGPFTPTIHFAYLDLTIQPG